MTGRSIAMMVAVGGALAATASASPRSINGWGNNLTHPEWGMLGTEQVRMGPVRYADGLGAPVAGMPSPRAISNAVGVQTRPVGNARGLSAMFWQWGQFIDHDFAHVLEDESTSMPISVPMGDPFFDPMGTGTAVINQHRSQFTGGATSPRAFGNALTHWLDGSMVYGSDDTRAGDLRAFSGGRLRTSANDMMPYNTSGLPNAGGTGSHLFIAGDVRANEQVALAGMHTLFVREHNRTADRLAIENPTWNDDRLYDTARAIVGAKIQKITYEDWLPALLGNGALSSYSGYDASVDPSVSLEFTTSAFRFGHTMLNGELPMVGPQGQDFGSLSLRDAFFNVPLNSDPEVMQRTLKGLTGIEANEIDTQVIDDVRNFLFGPPGAGGFDLLALNINRGRDHGIGTYNDLRATFGLDEATSFADVTSDAAVQAALASVYTTVDDIDPWIGMAAEDHLPGASVGELFAAIFVDQFERLRDGDRYFYLNDADLAPYLAEIESTTLADIMMGNLDVGVLQRDVFFVPAPAGAALLALGGLVATRRRR